MTFEWTPDLAVGVEEIDMQHRELFKRIGTLVSAINEGRGADEVQGLFDFLGDYIGSHFTTEVKCMHILSYPKMADHRAQHDIFVRAVKDAKREYDKDGASDALAETLKTHICDWLVNHVKEVDMQLAAFLKERTGGKLTTSA